jgi:protein O-GlcNAc transferase
MNTEQPVMPLGVRLLRAQAALYDRDIDRAVIAFRQLIAQAPGLPQARFGLASAMAAAGQPDEAAKAMDAGRVLLAAEMVRGSDFDLRRCQSDRDYAIQVADRFYTASLVAIASTIYGLAVAAGPVPMIALLRYGLALHHTGRPEEALAVFRTAADNTVDPAAAEFLLPAHFPAANGVERQAIEARRWADRYAPGGPEPVFGNAPAEGRRLRIGYVAPSFVNNQARQFLAPLLDNHDREAVEVFLYPQAVETGPWSSPVVMRPIGELPDREAAALIRDDGIDVLVDVWGHNAGGRLPVFAHRPAPVQVSWLNYMQTTGVRAMDYTLHSDTVDQPGMQDLFCETIWRMGVTSAPFRPDRPPSMAPTPMARNGYPTFGSFSHPSKVTPVTIELWSSILRRVPKAQLVLKYRYYTDPVLQAATGAQFAAHGIDPLRLHFQGHTTGDAYAVEFDRIDLMLDPTPAPGGTTTMEALAHGVPVLTLAGETYYSRIGVELLAGAGLPELVAASAADYVETAVDATADSGRLQALRERVAPGFAAAPYRDEKTMTRRFESSFSEMFRIWSRGQPMANSRGEPAFCGAGS